MKPLKIKKFNQPIIYCKYLDNDTLLIVDKDTTLRYLDINTFETLSGFKLNIKHTWYKNSIVSFNDDGSLFALQSADYKYSQVYSAKSKKAIAKINRHEGKVSCVAVDPKGKYFFSCGEDGKTFVVDIKSTKLSFTLPSHSDEINDIVFSDNAQYIATASYDKKIYIFNLSIMAPHAKLISHTAPVKKIKFLSKHRFFSIDKSNNAIIWDLNTNKIIVRLSAIHDDVLKVTSNKNFLFLATALGYVIVYELKNYEQISRKFLDMDSAITMLEFNEKSNELVIATQSGVLASYDIYEGKQELQKLLNENKYDEMEKYVKNNPFLQYSKPYVLMMSIWDRTVDKITELLQHSKNNEVKNTFREFKNIPSKNTIMKKMLEEYAEFDKFLLMVKKGNIALAYSIANKHPSYKDSKVYKALEIKWRKIFFQAQQIILKPKGKEKAMELLAPYRGVSEKTKHIQEMFSKSEIYSRFKNAITQKEFKIVFELIKVNKFLKEFPEYFSILKLGDSLFIKSSKFIQEGDFHAASKLLQILQDFPDFENDAKKMLRDIENQDKFLKAIDDDLVVAYNLLDKSTILSKTLDGKNLINQYKDDLEMAEIYASKGNIAKIDTLLEKYKKISSKSMSIATIYAWAYNMQIEDAIKHNKSKEIVEGAIKNYILFFGLDDHIVSAFNILTKKHKNIKLNIKSLKKGSKELWKPSMRVINILE
ncbi:MAG: hypothetical protein L3I99_00010 [Sulfurimonas sp.]|nr:hypothetical protein [Sulfurimonas sp.]